MTLYRCSHYLRARYDVMPLSRYVRGMNKVLFDRLIPFCIYIYFFFISRFYTLLYERRISLFLEGT